MDEEMISRRFWFEHESGRRLFPQRQKNQLTGKTLYRVGKGAGANKVKNQLELDDIEEVYRYVFQRGWQARMAAADGWHGMYAKAGRSIVRTSEDQPFVPTADDYRLVFKNLGLSRTELGFLVAHYYAINQQTSMEDLADAVGYSSYASANLHYGALAHRVAVALSEARSEQQPEYSNWLQVLAHSNGERDEKGHFLWSLRREVSDAMESLRWVAPDLGGGEIDGVDDGGAVDTAEPGSTTREAVVQARRGQGPFRIRVCQYWGGRCAVTDCALTGVLIASHIKPWASSSDSERLDGFNGLLLVPNLDKLFDAQLISFDENGRMLVSKALPGLEAEVLGLTPGMRLRYIHDRHRDYLRAHQDRSEAMFGTLSAF